MKSLHSFFLAIATVLITTTSLSAQTLNANGSTYTINAYSSPQDTGSVQDYTIPSNTLYNFISFTLRGGDGGFAKAGANCKSNGGAGATTEAVFWIGTGTNELQPGGTIRFVVGKHGENGDVGGSNNTAGGGGGGTAVLYRPNSTENWTILAVAGGGGGAHQGNVFGGCVDSQLGQGGRSSENGGDGEGNNHGNGGTNGNAGSSGSNTLNHGAGGGGANSGNGGGKGLPDGGDGGNSSSSGVGDGGYGFGGGGGAGNNGGGGGGGYSGGGGGATYNNGGGGGSYANPNYAYSSTKTEGSLGGGNSQNGHVDYTIYDSEIVWTGAVNTAWNNTGNWSPARLPQSIDHVTIPNVTNDPVLSTTATIKSLDIQASAALTVAEQGILNVSKSILIGIKVSGTLTNKGLIQINNTGGNALAIFGSNDAAAYLYGDLNIGNSSNIGGTGIYVEGSVLVDKDPANTAETDLNPTININNVSANGISCLNCDITIDETSYGSFKPTVNINIGTSGTIGNIGIANTGDLNLLDGTITIGNTTSHGLVNTSFAGNPGEIFVDDGALNIGSATKPIGGSGLQMNTGTFFNSGTLNVRNTAADGIENSSSFTNNASGSIHIDQTTTNGIKCSGGTFTNNGQAVLGQFSNIGSGGISLSGTGKFTNNASGTLSLWQTSNEGISATSTSVFENFGVLNVGGLGGTGIGGIGISCLSSFNNKPSGVIFVDQTAIVGIVTISSGVFNNEGNITIGANAAIGFDGIQNQATFNNLASGSIFIEQVGQYGIYNLKGSFSNAGSIKIGENGSIANSAIANGNGTDNPVFLNGPCSAVIHIFKKNITDVNNSFTNSGTILQESTGNSNIETNNGTILYNAGTFTAGNGNAPISLSGSFTDKKIWRGCTDNDWATAENWAPIGVPTAADEVVIYPATNAPIIASGTAAQAESVSLESGAALTNSGSLTVNDGALLINTGATAQGNGQYNLKGDFTVNGTFTPGNSTVNMSGDGFQGIISTNPTTTFYNLFINKPSVQAASIGANVIVTNSLSLSSGMLEIPSGSSLTTQFYYPIFRPASGTTLTNDGTLTVAGFGFDIQSGASVQGNGQYFFSGADTFFSLTGGTFDPGSSTVTFSGTGPQSIASDPMDFYNLVIDKATSNAELLGNITVANEITMTSGNLNLRGKELELVGSGTILDEGPSSYIYGTPVGFNTFGGMVKKTVDLNAPSAANPGNIGVIITSSANLGTTTIQRGHDVQDVNGEVSIKRYYDIAPANNSGLDATVRFSYFDHELYGNVEGGLNPFRFNGTDWDFHQPSASDASANWVETENVDAFSKWTLFSCSISTFYLDSDGDGFGDPDVSTIDCLAPSGYVADNTDCDDGNATKFPGAVEICDGLDNDCNGTIDDGLTTWTGTNGTGWNDAGNWTNGVPEACDEVIIPDVVNDPIIDGSTTAVAKSVTVEADALLSIASGGSLSLDVVSNNLGIDNYGTIDNTGTITVDGPTGDGIYNEGTLENAGTINIGHTQSPTGQGIQVVGTLTNTGTLDVRRGNDNGVQVDAGGQLTNESTGIVFIGKNSGSFGVHALKVFGTFTNDGGTVNADNATENGIRAIGGTINNLNGGTINIGTAEGNIGRVGLVLNNSAYFNNDGSTLNIDNTGSSFAGFGEGIGCFTASSFDNKNSGLVNLGLDAGSIGHTGIYLFSNSTFTNDGADINIDNTGNDGIFTAANFNNKNGGNINIGWVDGNIVGDGLQVGFNGTFHNQVCSNTQVADNLNILADFTNDGYLLLNTAENHTPGNFVNNGMVEDVQGTFSGGTNNEVIISATTSTDCAVIAPAFQLGATVDFNILGIYSDENATQSAGTYDPVTNTFTPTNTLPETTTTLYVKVEDAVGGCTHILSWELTTANCCPSNVTCYLDSDGDTYGDPSISQLFCETCPSGYVLDNTDCDDTDADELPGKTWYEDADSDGYSTGTTQTACERPAGYRPASELVNTTDIDCNDGDANVNPNPDCSTTTRTWTGHISTDWNEACNWSPNCVPTFGDDVIIPDVANDPVISATSTISVRSVRVNAGGHLTVSSGGKLFIDFSTQFGIDNGGGTITNEGTIFIDITDSYGIYNRPGSTFDNTGTIHIGQNGGPENIGGAGIWNEATFNHDGFLITIDDTKDYSGIVNTGSGIFNNAGPLQIGQFGGTGNIANYGIENGAVFNHNASTITIDNARYGVWNDASGTFTNTAALYIGQNGLSNNISLAGITNLGAFNHNSSEITIDHVGNFAIGNFGDGIFTNLAIINIGQNGGTNSGIGNSATFNHYGAQINIDNTVSYGGVFNDGGTFNNAAVLNIGQNGGPDNVASYGIINLSAGTFNHDDSQINIDHAVDGGILNVAGSTFSNSSTIIIGAIGTLGGPGVSNATVFQNNSCAVIEIISDNVISNSGNFTNSGLLIENASGNSSISSNDGIVNNLNGGTFTIGTNNEIIVEATTTTDCSAISPAFGLGATVDFNILGVFTDENATQSAGTYNAGTNTFTPTNALSQASILFYVKIEDAVGGCTRIVEWTVINDGNVVTCYLDNDGDSFGDPAISQMFCDVCGTGYVTDNTDCDDGDGEEFPNQTWYIDADGDNYGGSSTIACERPAFGKTASEINGSGTDDCNDNDSDEFPGQTWYPDSDDDGYRGAAALIGCERPSGYKTADELINTTDVDCNDGDATVYMNQTWFEDMDGDGYHSGNFFIACNRPTGFKLASELVNTTDVDCDDSDADEFPGQTWYIDADGDTYGGSSATACERPTDGFLLGELMGTGTDDCDDNDGNEYPGQTWYIDGDGDNYGGSSTTACERPTDGFLLSELMGTGTDDCDDNDGNEYPGQTWYIDADGDNYGGSSATACERPTDGFLLGELMGTGTDDCDDNDGNEYPGQTWYIDGDGDNYGGSIINACVRPASGFLPGELMGTGTDDCNDGDGAINPAATEVCDGIDNDCDGLTDTADPSFVDNTAPTVNCQNISRNLGADGALTITASEVYASGSDDCGTVNLVSVSPNTFNCSNIGGNTVALTVNDGNGNGNTCTATVTVADITAPLASCQNLTIGLDANGSASVSAAQVDNGSSDNCGVASTSLDITTFGCANIGANTVTLTVDDGNGNSNTCTASVTVEDNTAPNAQCVATPVSATLNASGEYTLDPNDLDDGSSDACGSVSLTASPSLLDCSDEGPNTVTLTVTDDHGNTAACTATVEVAAFFSINNIIENSETCAGAGDGSITIEATTGGGQIGYSVDGGANFQFSNTFNSLTPGTYNLVVKIFGINAVCEKTAAATIGAGGQPQDWYRDMDGDGHSDGITMTACTQPAGYYLATDLQSTDGDCNDNDANEYPGQAWHEDLDGDGHGSGTSLVACQRPTGCFTAAELTTTSGDCNDTDAAIHPGATEVCNGIDDDCDGEVDENTTGGLTWTGNVAFYTQADVDAFSQCYSVIDGHVIIQGAAITDLTNLYNLEEVTGNLTVQFNGITSMAGLDNLLDVGGTLTIYFNSSLTTLDGLGALGAVGGNLMVYYNFSLSDGCAIHNLVNGGVSGSMSIFFNAVGCNSVAEINANCGGSNLVIYPNTDWTTEGQSLEENKTTALNDLEVSPIPAIQEMSVYPNPAINRATVRLEEMVDNGVIRVSDVTGRIVFEQMIEVNTDRLELDVTDWRAGTYFIIMKTKGFRQLTKRLVVIEE